LAVIFSFSKSIDSQAQEERRQPALAGENKTATPPSALQAEQRISLSLRNIEVVEALKFFAMKTGLNIVPTQGVSGRVTLTVENVPVKDVFDIMLRSNNLSYDKRGEIYNVMTEGEYKSLYGKNFFDTRQVKVFRLQNAIPDQAFSVLEALKSSIGRLLVEPESGTVLIMDTPEKIAEAQQALAGMEQKSVIKMFKLQYAKAKDVEEQLKSQLDTKKVGSVRADERTNQIIVQTLPERMKNIEELVAGLDKKTKAVLIDTKIIKIKLSDATSSGIQWEGLFNVTKQFGMAYVGSYPFSAVQSSSAAWRSREKVLSDMGGSVGSYPFSGTTSNLSGGVKVTPGKNMHVGIIDGKRDFDVLMNYLQTLGKTKILSNPTLSVINNQEAKIHVGERRAYITTTTTTGSTTSTVAEAVTYVDVGIQFSITPMINEDGYITMKVKPEISSVIGNVTTSSNNLIPIIDTSTAETTVIAKDGATIMIGGLGKEERVESSEQVPFLGKIPGLGFFFRSKTQSAERTELLIILTPIIFEGDKLVTAKDKEMELFGVKPLKKFDVFKEESFSAEVPKADESLKNAVTGEPLKGTFVPKGFKPYDLKEDIVPLAVPKTMIPISSPVKEKEDLITLKGFRAYN
jgi:type II secretory pathway component GspD/PulD (secretin)